MSSSDDFYFPAEFDPQQAIWMGWPVTKAYQRGLSLIPVFVEMIKRLTTEGDIAVRLAVQNEGEKHSVMAILKEHGVPEERLMISCIPHMDIWFRDMGPVFLKNKEGTFRIVQFNFNTWSYESPSSPGSLTEKNVSALAAKDLQLELVRSAYISEGGNREFNGRGVMMVVEAVEHLRNPEMTREQMEAEYRRIFNLNKIIWLKHGVYEDDSAFMNQLPGPYGFKDVWHTFTTGGHIDEVCRFVTPNTVLLAEVTPAETERDPIARENFQRLERNNAILKEATDQDGNPLMIRRITVPEPLYVTMRPGDAVYDNLAALYKTGAPFPLTREITVIPAMSYLNFLITNKLVLMPYYWKPGFPEIIREKDHQAQNILRELFPDRKICPIDTMAINVGGGGMHCITQQQPS
jgi:agmatine deiminase